MTAMTGNNGMTSEINVTPLIDVLLVLLIIFMVIVPAIPNGEAVAVPQPVKGNGGSGEAIVLEVIKDGANAVKFRINQQAVARGELQARLSAIYAARAQRVLILKGEDTLSFTQMAEVIDIGHAAGIDRIGLMTPGILAGR